MSYHTTLPGTKAFAVRGRQTLFSEALLACLQGGVAEKIGGQWCVTTASLDRGLAHHLDRLERKHKKRQRFRVSGGGENVVLSYLAGPPDVDVDMELVPHEVAPKAAVTVNDLVHPEQTFGPPLAPHPFRTTMPAGQYLVTTRVAEPDRTRQQLEDAASPYRKWVLELGSEA